MSKVDALKNIVNVDKWEKNVDSIVNVLTVKTCNEVTYLFQLFLMIYID